MSTSALYAVRFLTIIFYAEGFFLDSKNYEYSQESAMNVSERVQRNGYRSEEYTAVTEDGYLLKMFRIGDQTGPPLLLQHGLLLSADCWIETGPHVGLAYLLVDAGYDVWLGNNRGNFYSRNHMTLDPDTDAEFWHFGSEEMGKYDLPAFIDTILERTGVNQLSYVGFSQGGGTFFVMCSERPEYCQKVKIMVALAPSTRHLSTTSIFFNVLTRFSEIKEHSLVKAGIFEALPVGGPFQATLNIFCPIANVTIRTCEQIKDFADNRHPGSIADETYRTVFGHFPAGTSFHNLAHFGQLTRSKEFRKFDYGHKKNMVIYGTKDPPAYNFDAVTTPVAVISGRNDGIVDIRDVRWAVDKLPNVVDFIEVEDPLWTHLDMPYSSYVPKVIYPKVVHYLSMFR